MLQSHDAIFHENSLETHENANGKVIIDQQLLAERQKAEHIMHFFYKDTETINERAQELPIDDKGTGTMNLNTFNGDNSMKLSLQIDLA